MPEGPAARVGDPVSHAAPTVLGPALGSTDVMIGYKGAWRGVGAAAAAAILEAKEASDKAIKAAEDETEAAAAISTDKEEAAKEKEDKLKDAEAAAMGSMIAGAAGLADQHVCTTVLPIPPHGAGVVVDGSQTVFINDLPACREGDTIVEAIGPPNLISMGESTVIIGG